MIIYVVLMLAVGIAFGVLSAMIFRGRTDLIHDYHQTKVRDKKGYAKAMGRALAILSVGCLSSALVSVFWVKIAPILLIVGITISLVLMVAAQIKYNHGIF